MPGWNYGRLTTYGGGSYNWIKLVLPFMKRWKSLEGTGWSTLTFRGIKEEEGIKSSYSSWERNVSKLT